MRGLSTYFNDYLFTADDKFSLLSISKELDVSNSCITLDSIETTSSEVLYLLRSLDVSKAEVWCKKCKAN